MTSALTAVNVQDRTRQERGLLEIHHGASDVADLADVTDRVHPLDELLRRLAMHRRSDVAGRDGVDANALSGVLDGQARVSAEMPSLVSEARADGHTVSACSTNVVVMLTRCPFPRG